MTEPEQPDTPPLTRKRMRDIRNTGATPVVTSADVQDAAAPAVEAEPTPVVAVPPVPVAPLPRAAAPIVMPDPPMADVAVDLGVTPLTRRQARQQERIRTASVPVITSDVIAAHTAASAASPVADTPEVETPAAESAEVETPAAESAALETPAAETPDVETADSAAADADDTATSALRGLFSDAEPEGDAEHEVVVVDEPSFEPVEDEDEDEDDEAGEDAVASLLGDDAVDGTTEGATTDVDADTSERPVVSPLLGAALFAEEPSRVDLPPSFDDLLAAGSTGSIGTSSALIFSPPTGDSPIVAPVTATGEVLVTGTFNLPEGLGSLGHAPGTADGREADAVLVDGELPAHSSPTPIAASAAISTVKSNGDVIKPPVPEKGSRLMMTLAITAGALALALVGVLILAFVNGVF